MARRTGFTLIELLIVVAIIAILAAIAVPNFLEAQTRSKVSRVKNDLRTLSTTIEMYQMDWNSVPFDGQTGGMKYGWINIWATTTTPIAYTTNILLDVFKEIHPEKFPTPPPGQTFFMDGKRHSYDFASARYAVVNYQTMGNWVRHFGPSPWFTGSCGPDNTFLGQSGSWGLGDMYDPTNGTVSEGDIYRSTILMP